MSFASPVGLTIYDSPGTVGGKARWFRSQRFGCTGFWKERPLGSCAHFNRGTDIARGPDGEGDPVYAAEAGTAFYVGIVTGGSKSIVIRHSGNRATGYDHLSSFAVKEGQKVTRGQRIGSIGHTGNTTGPHLDWPYKENFPATADVADFYNDVVGKWVDPYPLLAQNQPQHTVHPVGDGINIRATQGSGTTLGAKYATTQAGHIVRVSDGADQGLTTTPRPYGGRVTGASYPAGQGYAAGNTWERIELAGAYRFLATPLAIVT